ncbi:MAG: CoA-transferase subunit beta [Actinomycetota bacterium]|nr:MAG: CoA-transferase subunit beta [Actinomycetota bacterium]
MELADTYTSDEMMSIAAARQLSNNQICFIGIGLPSKAANLARRLHAPDLIMIYESGTLGAKPTKLPLSIGDGELAETADTIVSVPEIFNYLLQPGKIDIGFLGAAQIDRYANLNSTVIGDYNKPSVRLPGAGGAPEIASSSKRVIVMLRQSTKSFVDTLPFVTSVGFGAGPGDREKLGLKGAGPVMVITDLGVLEPDSDTRELVLTHIHPNIAVEKVIESTGWKLRIANQLKVTESPTASELDAIRSLVSAGK